MWSSITTSWRDKRRFYNQPHIVESYEAQRFGGASGQRVARRELALALSMLPARGSVLDLACGTGRLSRALRARGNDVVALDVAWHMVRAARASAAVPVAVGDAFQLPFVDGAFDAVAALRLAFHYTDLSGLLREMARVTRPGGVLVLDTCTYSPRALVALQPERWGGPVQTHAPRYVRQLAAALDLRIEQAQSCFLGSPYLYRMLPAGLARVAEALETALPDWALSRCYWRLCRAAATPIAASS
jgi:SAM-dependent methyltransferase